MRLVMHILKKDLRHHWPEIVISLALLGLYVWTILLDANSPFFRVRFLWFRLGPESVTTALVLFWIFLTVRVVQGETLVGDRQWWVSKPYDWRTLLAAKELFVLLCFGVPLFFVQIYLLHHAASPFSATSRASFSCREDWLSSSLCPVWRSAPCRKIWGKLS
jgi:hypothetical protein